MSFLLFDAKYSRTEEQNMTPDGKYHERMQNFRISLRDLETGAEMCGNRATNKKTMEVPRKVAEGKERLYLLVKWALETMWEEPAPESAKAVVRELKTLEVEQNMTVLFFVSLPSTVDCPRFCFNAGKRNDHEREDFWIIPWLWSKVNDNSDTVWSHNSDNLKYCWREERKELNRHEFTKALWLFLTVFCHLVQSAPLQALLFLSCNYVSGWEGVDLMRKAIL